jgi:hypothetical protein
MITSGDGKYKVWLEQINVGADRIYVLGGGEKSHLGGVIICEPNRKTKIVKLEKHYDYVILKPIAEEACRKYKTKTIAIGGVHIDNATKSDINIIINNCRSLLECI